MTITDTGHEFTPEPKPLPTELGSVIIATEVRGVRGKWRMLRGVGRRWYSTEPISGYHWHSPDRITAWAEARIVPVTAAPATQHAAPAEGELIDPDDVRARDRVRLVLDNGDEVTITATRFNKSWFESRHAMCTRSDIRAVYLLHREEA